MQDKKILSAVIQDRTNYDQIADHVDIDKFGPEIKLIWNEVIEYYQADASAACVDREILLARLERRLPDPKHSSRCQGIVKDLPEVSGTNVVREVLELQAHSVGLELAAGIAAGKGLVSLRPLGEKWLTLADASDLDNPNEEITNVQLKALVERRLDNRNLIQIAPRALNDRLDGGARPGHHVLVFAPTEMGKTLFVINMVAHMLRTGVRVLYVGNEDPAEDIILRLASRVSGLDKFRLKDSADSTQEVLDKAGWNNFVFADLAPGTFPRINRLVKKYKPQVVVLDQLSNINVAVSRNESKTGSLEAAAKEARALAKKHQILVVSVTQAADSATGKAVLGRGDVHNSNVGIPAQVDVMIGIGADESMEVRGLREVSLVKNKVSGNHDHFTVTFDPIYSKVS